MELLSKGFLIQARSNLTDTAVVTFDTSTDAHKALIVTATQWYLVTSRADDLIYFKIYLLCFFKSASTHVGNYLKTSISVVWNVAPSEEGVTFV